MTEEIESCYFYRPGKQYKCGALNAECDGTTPKDICSFRMSAKEFYEARNAAIEKNRLKGNCSKCKYKPAPCELLNYEG